MTAVDDVIPAVPQIEVSGEARLGHDGWVSEFDSFQWSDKKGNGGGSAAPVSARSGRSTLERGGTSGGGDPTKAMDNLRAEIKLLHWHKLANEAALKAALLKTRKIKARGGGTSRPVPAMTTLAMPTEERAAWMQQVVEEEQSKPLQVSKDFMSKYEEQEKETEGRLDTEVAAHIRSLRNLRKQIEKRGEMKARRIKYRAAQKQLELEKQQLLLGKLHETGSSGPVSSSKETRDAAAVAAGKLGSGRGAQKTVGALDTVLSSLDKLVELEKRISSLEKSNVYDDFRATKKRPETESRSLGRRTMPGSRASGGAASRRQSAEGRPGVAGPRSRRLSFSKQTTEATIDAPSRTYYSVRVRRKPDSTAGNSKSLKRRCGEDVVVGQRTDGRGGASTFLTQLPDVHRHQRPGQQRGGGGRGGGFRSAIGEKKRIEAKRRLAGDRAEAERVARQDRIIREWMQRKRAAAAAASSGSRRRKPAVAPAHAEGRPGAASTNRKNMHLQEFRNIRAHYAKRSERLRRDLSRRQGGALFSGTRTTAVARPRAPAGGSGAPSSVSRNGMVVSRTNPGLQRRREAVRASVEAKRGALVGGTTMRRTGLSVGGTGLRAARAQRQKKSEPAATATRRRDRSRTKRTAVLPVVRGVGHRKNRTVG